MTNRIKSAPIAPVRTVAVADLQGLALDHWAARAADALGLEPGEPGEPWRPSTDWCVGGPIIEARGIWLAPRPVTADWEAGLPRNVGVLTMRGPTPLVAAMRVFVASRFGAEVEE